MSPIAVALDLLLAGLMLVALVVGGRLNQRLKTLRDSQASFAQSVAELNEAAGRAEAALASLRAASESAHDELLTRIETARGLIAKLDTANQRAEQAAASPPSTRAGDQRNDTQAAAGGARPIRSDLAASVSRAADVPRPPAFAPTPPSTRPPARPTVDDELFEGQAPPSKSARRPAPASTVPTWNDLAKGDHR